MNLKSLRTWIRTNHAETWSGPSELPQDAGAVSQQFTLLSLLFSPFLVWLLENSTFDAISIGSNYQKNLKNGLVAKRYISKQNTCMLYFVSENSRYCSLQLLSSASSPSLHSLLMPSGSSLQLRTALVLDKHPNLVLHHNTYGEPSSQSPRIYHQK